MRIRQPRLRLSGPWGLRLLILAFALTVLITTVIPSPASAQTPPHKFVGGASSVTLVNGTPAADGLVVVAYDEQGAAVAWGTIIGGVWTIDVQSTHAQSVRFAIGASTWTTLFPVIAGSLTEVSLNLQTTIVEVDSAPETTPIIRIGWEHYTLQAGEDLAGVADRYGLSLAELLDRNPQINDPTALGAGDVIILRQLGVGPSAEDAPQTATPNLNAIIAPIPAVASPDNTSPSAPSGAAEDGNDGFGIWLLLAAGAGGLMLVVAVVWWFRRLQQNRSAPAKDGGIPDPDAGSHPGWALKDRPSILEAEPIFRAKTSPAATTTVTLPTHR